MKLSNVTPNILKLSYIQEKSDEGYGTCLWAIFLFDLDDYTLHIESDCGNYAYGWCKTPDTESFVKLMCRINEDYLLGKISDRSKFDIEESKKQTIAKLDDYMFACIDDYEKCINDIKDIEYCGDEGFYRECENILDNYNVYDAFTLIDVVLNYPAGAVKITEIFSQYIQPYLRIRY